MVRQPEPEELRRRALALYKGNDPAAAAALQARVVAAATYGADEPCRVDDAKRLGLFRFNSGDIAGAASALETVIDSPAVDGETVKNFGVCLDRLGRTAEALVYLERAKGMMPDNPLVLDGLASVACALGRPEDSIRYGIRSLELKAARRRDSSGQQAESATPPPVGRRIIAYSLWGDDSRYLQGILDNARLIPHLYPGWTCRVYHDATVPSWLLKELQILDVETVAMPSPGRLWEGLFWRFRVAADPDVERFLVRDADSVVNTRERAAVDAWIASGRQFHVMRDWYTHTDLILAGLWGGMGGVLPGIVEAMGDFLADRIPARTVDQEFLARHVWPAARPSVLIHDSLHPCLGARPFPQTGRLPAGQHVGQNATVTRQARWRAGSRGLAERRFVFTVTTGRTGTQWLSALLSANLAGAEVHHERSGWEAFGTDTPDVSTFTLFNSKGNIPPVRSFWERKFRRLRNSDRRTYVETSHYLAKAGLVENLDLLPESAEIHLVLLRRDVADLVWSFHSRCDFANLGFTWLFALDPRYPNAIVSSTPFLEHGAAGIALWYVVEMWTRQEYYRRLLADHPRIHIHDLDLNAATSPAGVKPLMDAVAGRGHAMEDIELPRRMNATRGRPWGPAEESRVRSLVRRFNFDPVALAETFVAQGRRLGRGRSEAP